MMHTRVELEALSTARFHIPEDQDSLRDKLRPESTQRDQSIQMDLVHGQPAHRRRSAPQILQNADNNSIASQSIGARANQHPFRCRAGCRCSCHEQKKSSTSSSFMNRLLGQIFIGYAGLSMISPKCDHADCEKAQTPVVSIEYWFPLGFCCSKIVQLQLSYRSILDRNLTFICFGACQILHPASSFFAWKYRRAQKSFPPWFGFSL